MELTVAPETLDLILLELQDILENGDTDGIVFENLADLYAILYKMTDVHHEKPLVFTITDVRLKPLV